MRNPNDILINLRKHSNESTYQYLRLYRNLFNEQMFYAAYQRIYAKPGNMTSSTDGRTIDQMTLQRIDDIIKTTTVRLKPVIKDSKILTCKTLISEINTRRI